MRLVPCLLAAATALQLPSIRTAVRPRVSALRMAEEGAPEPVPTPAPTPEAPAGWQKVEETNIWGDDKVADIRIEGGQTLKTFQMPAHAERVSITISPSAAAGPPLATTSPS